jgi:hypothetical protein
MEVYFEWSILEARYAGESQGIADALDRLEPSIIDELVRDSR